MGRFDRNPRKSNATIAADSATGRVSSDGSTAMAVKCEHGAEAVQAYRKRGVLLGYVCVKCNAKPEARRKAWDERLRPERTPKELRDEWYELAALDAALEAAEAEGCGYCGVECEHEPKAYMPDAVWSVRYVEGRSPMPEVYVNGDLQQWSARTNPTGSARAVLVPYGLMQSDADMTEVLRSSSHWTHLNWRESPLKLNPITLKHPDGTSEVVGARLGKSADTMERMGMFKGVNARSMANLKRKTGA